MWRSLQRIHIQTLIYKSGNALKFKLQEKYKLSFCRQALSLNYNCRYHNLSFAKAKIKPNCYLFSIVVKLPSTSHTYSFWSIHIITLLPVLLCVCVQDHSPISVLNDITLSLIVSHVIHFTTYTQAFVGSLLTAVFVI